MRTYATHFNLDPSRIVILGSSAGGQIAASVGTYGAGRTRVRAVVGISGVMSPYRAWGDGLTGQSDKRTVKLHDNAVILARCYPDSADTTCWKRWCDMVVKNHVTSDDAPMYLVDSADDWVSPKNSLDLADQLRAKGVPVTTDIVPGSAHGGALLDDPQVRDSVLAYIRSVTR